MVTSMILSRYVGTPPRDGEDRKIQGGPLYLDIIDLIDECDTLPWTKRCIRDVQSLSLDADDIKSMVIKAVTKGRFLGSNGVKAVNQVYGQLVMLIALSTHFGAKLCIKNLITSSTLNFL